MACSKTNIKSISMICVAARLVWLALVLELVRGQRQRQDAPPALYMFGDSQLDVGNNNYVGVPGVVGAVLKANHPHYGVDSPWGGATGRYSNGFNLADFIADSLGAPRPPAYRSIKIIKIGDTTIVLKGVNFAYGFARVRDPKEETGPLLDIYLRTPGIRDINLEQQIERDYLRVRQLLVRQLGETQANAHLASSIFVIAVGSTDIVERILFDRDEVNPDYSLFVDELASSFKQHLGRLYDLGMRKVLVVGTGPLGRYPVLRLLSNTTTRDDVDFVSVRYNLRVRHSPFEKEVRYSFLDQYTVLQRYMQEPQANGYADVEAPCCSTSGFHNQSLAGRIVFAPECNRDSSLCPDRRDHMFWDFFHLTEVTTQKLAAVAFNGSEPDVSPVNLRDLSAP